MYRLHVTASSRIDIVTSQPLKVNSRKELGSVKLLWSFWLTDPKCYQINLAICPAQGRIFAACSVCRCYRQRLGCLSRIC